MKKRDPASPSFQSMKMGGYLGRSRLEGEEAQHPFLGLLRAVRRGGRGMRGRRGRRRWRGKEAARSCLMKHEGWGRGWEKMLGERPPTQGTSSGSGVGVGTLCGGLAGE